MVLVRLAHRYLALESSNDDRKVRWTAPSPLPCICPERMRSRIPVTVVPVLRAAGNQSHPQALLPAHTVSTAGAEPNPRAKMTAVARLA